jgi:hypothetical protein
MVIENNTSWAVFFAQAGVPLPPAASGAGAGVRVSGHGDVITPQARASVGWDVPCPPPARRSELLALRLSLAPLDDSEEALLADAVVGPMLGASLRGSEAVLPITVPCFCFQNNTFML